MPGWNIPVPVTIIVSTVVVISLLIFSVTSFLLREVRRKNGWLTWIVIASYIIGVTCPAVMGMMVFGNAIRWFHYQVPDPALFGLACIGWVLMAGCMVAGGAWIMAVINHYPEEASDEVSSLP